MWIICKYNIIGLHFLMLTHIAHTFVLLTANVDDVKKLAKQFVSESLAEKIGNYIRKAGQDVESKVSEENEMNAVGKAQQVSDENNRYKYVRRGPKRKAQEKPKLIEDTVEMPEKESSQRSSEPNEQKVPKFENKNQNHNLEKPTYAVRLEGPSRYVTVASNTVKQYVYPRESNKKYKSRVSEEKESDKNEPKERGNNSVSDTSLSPSNSLYMEKYARDNKPVNEEDHQQRLNSIEDNEVDDYGKDSSNNGNVDDFSSNNLFNQKISAELTTRKAFFEFDQYGITKKNQDSEFFGTSGPVVLRKVAENKMLDKQWWEKEFPDEIESKRESWL